MSLRAAMGRSHSPMCLKPVTMSKRTGGFFVKTVQRVEL